MITELGGLLGQIIIELIWQLGQMKIAAFRITILCNQFKDNLLEVGLKDL